MSHIPLLSDEQMRNLGRILGAGHTINLYNSTAKGQRRLPTYTENASATATQGGAILARVVDNDDVTVTATLYPNGPNDGGSQTVTVYAVEKAFGSKIPVGSWILVFPSTIKIFGGND